MSEISELIRGHIILADFANADPQGKLNVIGGGARFIPLMSNGMTPPLTAVFYAEIDVPVDEDVAMEYSLATSTGQLMSLPGPGGRKQSVRVGQNVRFNPVGVPNMSIPRNVVPTSAQFIMNFAEGLPLKEGFSYQFRMQADHQPIASYSFYIPTGPAMPVVG